MTTISNLIVSCPGEYFRTKAAENNEPPLFSLESTELSPNDFLAQQPNGCYSGARTLNKRCVMNFSSHLERLLLGMKNKSFVYPEKYESEEKESTYEILAPLRDGSKLFPLVESLCKFGLTYYFKGAPSDNEAKLTILISYNGDTGLPIVKLHLSPLSIPKGPMCEVEVFGHPRSNPSVKDTQWVKDRRELEKGMAPGINEILLVDEYGNVFEGMSSNFFAVVKNDETYQVWTCPLEHVLKGTVMCMVVDGCKHLNIPLLYKFPSIQDAARGSWSSAFITSTSRLMLPISKIHIRTPGAFGLQDSTILLPSPMDQPHISSLLNYVKSHVECNSTLLV